MSVFPGFGGQSFIEDVLPKTTPGCGTQGYQGHVEMDGGLNRETLPRCAAAGADVLVAGSALSSGRRHGDRDRSDFRLPRAGRLEPRGVTEHEDTRAPAKNEVTDENKDKPDEGAGRRR